jgi:Cdc6-like AAA superfamily ATPase
LPLLDAKLAKIRQWLSAPDPSTNYQKALKKRQADTGLWLLEGKQYVKWKTEDNASPLWLYGIPGCGKTILSSTVLHNVLQHCDSDPGKVVAYFYFDFNDKQKQEPELMLRSLICQLSQQCVKIPPSLDTLFSSCENGQRQPSQDALLEVIQHMIQDFPQPYVVIDALDECGQLTELLDILKTIAQLQNLHLLVTSRKERQIESSLERFVDSHNAICLQSELVDEDIQRYVRQRLANDESLKKWQKDPTVSQEIETALMEGARGMYLISSISRNLMLTMIIGFDGLFAS